MTLKEIKNIALGQAEVVIKPEEQAGTKGDDGSTQAEVLVQLKGAKEGSKKGGGEEEGKGEVLWPSGRSVRGPRGPSGIAREADEGADLPGSVVEPY